MPRLAPTPIAETRADPIVLGQRKRSTKFTVEQAVPQRVELTVVKLAQPQRAQVTTLAKPQTATLLSPRASSTTNNNATTTTSSIAAKATSNTPRKADAAGDVSDDEDSTDSLGDDNVDIETILYVQENGKQVQTRKKKFSPKFFYLEKKNTIIISLGGASCNIQKASRIINSSISTKHICSISFL